MKKLAFLLLIVLVSCQDTNEIKYKVSHLVKDGTPLLHINMQFKANPSGETVLLLQDKAWGEENLYNVLRDLRSEQASEIIKERDSNRIVIKHKKGIEKIHLSYNIQQDTKGCLTTKGTYRPVIQETYFHVFSHNVFMIPGDYVPDATTPFDVIIEWVGFDEDFNLVNSFDTNNRKQKITDTNEHYFHSAIFTGGDYRPYILDIKGNKAVLGIRGDWEIFQDSTLVHVLEKTLNVQREFWKDHSQKYFAVTMTPTYQERGSSFQGSGLTNSFATSATNNEYLELKGLVYLFNHELQHNWIGLLIKNDNEEEQYWFSEGFTDYYTIKNIAKNKIYNLDESYFINEFNQMIKVLYTSPVKEAPNKDINYDNFWTSRDYEKLPYRRGALFAFYLDNKIKQDSNGAKSLDDLMLELKEDALKNQQRITHSYFISKANKYLNEDLKPFFDLHIESGKLYDLESIFKEFGYQFNPTSEVYDLGFTFSEDKKQVADIEEDSNAYKAGLRKGDQITGRSYYIGYTDYEATIKIKKGKKEVTYKFFPTKLAAIPTLLNNQNNIKTLSF
ncbi:MAG: hypothetical protein JKY02_04405 [Flavobacteriaceae bacterium]|nr:hypothetical protein [Flavobacteriaceae bacterium]